MNSTATKMAAAAATPMATYIHPSLLSPMPRNVVRIVAGRNPLKGPPVLIRSVIVVVALTACGPAGRAVTAGKHAVIECGKQDASSIAALLAAFGVRSAIAGKLDVKELETAATGAALGVASCAYASFIQEYRRLRKEQVAALGGDVDELVQLQQALAKVSGGAKVVLADGTEVH